MSYDYEPKDDMDNYDFTSPEDESDDLFYDDEDSHFREEFGEEFSYYDENPADDPFVEAHPSLAYKDGVVEKLLDILDEYLMFATKADLTRLIEENF